MPIYEYQCSACAHRFELFVRPPVVAGASPPDCPRCHAPHPERVDSLFAVDSEQIRQKDLANARRAGQKELLEKRSAEIEFEKNHDH